MPDGRLWFNTKIDNSQIEKDLKEIERKIKKSQESISKMQNAKLPLVKQSEELGAKLDEAKAKTEKLRQEMENMNRAMQQGGDPALASEAFSRKAEVEAAIKESEKEVQKLQKQWDAVNDKVENYDRKIEQANTDIDRASQKAKELNAQLATPAQRKFAETMEKANKTADKFGKRIWEIGKSALVFNLISSGLQKAAAYMGNALKMNGQYTEQLAKLKGALLTAFQPLYEYVLPGAIAVLRVLTAIVSVVANVLSFLTGKTLSQSAQNAKALNKQAAAIGGVGDAAEEAKKQLMGFDEINRLESTSTGATGGGSGGGAGGISPDFGDFNTEEYKAKIDRLTAILSGALLAIGAILAFSGVNIPLGIALMAAGAVGLLSVAKENWGALEDLLKGELGGFVALLSTFLLPLGAILAFSGVNIPLGIALMAAGLAGLAVTNNISWGSMSQELKNEVTELMVILGGAMLAIGAVVAFSGANIPLGIGLMAMGAFGLCTAASLNWNGIVEALRGPTGEIIALASSALLALGLVLAFSGAATPLGIAMIAAGAVGLVTVGAMNWDAIQQKLKEVWGNIKQWFNTSVAPKLTISYWQDKFSGIAEGLKQKIKDGVNGGIALFNSFISWINGAMHFQWGGLSAFGQTIIPPGSFQLFTLPNIPYLAEGAVLPANKPFLAMVGDQRNGTNIEAPLETIKQALAEVMAQYGGGDVNITFTGELAALGRVLAPVVTKAQRDNDRGRGR